MPMCCIYLIVLGPDEQFSLQNLKRTTTNGEQCKTGLQLTAYREHRGIPQSHKMRCIRLQLNHAHLTHGQPLLLAQREHHPVETPRHAVDELGGPLARSPRGGKMDAAVTNMAELQRVHMDSKDACKPEVQVSYTEGRERLVVPTHPQPEEHAAWVVERGRWGWALDHPPPAIVLHHSPERGQLVFKLVPRPTVLFRQVRHDALHDVVVEPGAVVIDDAEQPKCAHRTLDLLPPIL